MFSLTLPIIIPINKTITPPPKTNVNPSPCSYSRSQTRLTVTKHGNAPLHVALGDYDGNSLEPLPVELKAELMPKHVAVIMDGHGRWAKLRGLPVTAGHKAGMRTVRKLVRLCYSWGVRVLTMFHFSNDNWVRSEDEVDYLMTLFERTIASNIDTLQRQGIRLSMIGDKSKLPLSLQRMVNYAEESTKDNSKLQLIPAISYSGKYDVIQACKRVALKVKDGLVQLEDINENIIQHELETNCTEFPNPDLLIRTSGELRISNFLLWQSAYTELFFSQKLVPDFGKAEFVEALISFQQRQRRFGGRQS